MPIDEIDFPRTETPVKFVGSIDAYLSVAELTGADRINMQVSMNNPRKTGEWVGVECGFDNVTTDPRNPTITEAKYNERVNNYIGNDRLSGATDATKNSWRVQFRDHFVRSHEVESVDDSSSSGTTPQFDLIYTDYLVTCDPVNDTYCSQDRDYYVKTMYETYYCWLD